MLSRFSYDLTVFQRAKELLYVGGESAIRENIAAVRSLLDSIIRAGAYVADSVQQELDRLGHVPRLGDKDYQLRDGYSNAVKGE